ncbi:probable ATP-dependent RNA helicase pitchoune isoform X1 [Battus philenor]|uniref:probable ATP-dependent RNA helicase pitchoune isoform X1 n=1 Tax=Battus philenor TaxID=42288 RepID=UPI0035D05A2D
MNTKDIIAQSTFSMLKGKIDDRILSSLKSMGFEKPTEIQAKILPHLLIGQDVIGTAKTGSGKTLAFLIPVIEKLVKLKFTPKHGVGCIIISPTRELALQTNEVLQKLLSEIDLSHQLITGGEKKCKETISLQKGVNIIVSTPGRLLDHLQNTEFNFKNLKCLILDEADKLLEAGFEKHIMGILNILPEKRQTALFSATMDNKVKNLAGLALKTSPVQISVQDKFQTTVAGLQQGYFICQMEERIPWLNKMLKKCKKLKVMVFFSSCKSVDFHYEFFKSQRKTSIISIHGKLSQSCRKEAYRKFVEAKKGVLFCTDVAARGLDIPSVDWIVQYDPPTDVKEYIHRVGRTARGLNNTGNAVILLRTEEEGFIDFLKTKNVFLDKYNFEKPSSDVLQMLQHLIENNGVMKILARKAYLSFLRCYKKHPMNKFFDINNIDLEAAAKAFGFLHRPHVDFLNIKKKRKHQENSNL